MQRCPPRTHALAHMIRGASSDTPHTEAALLDIPRRGPADSEARARAGRRMLRRCFAVNFEPRRTRGAGHCLGSRRPSYPLNTLMCGLDAPCTRMLARRSPGGAGARSHPSSRETTGRRRPRAGKKRDAATSVRPRCKASSPTNRAPRPQVGTTTGHWKAGTGHAEGALLTQGGVLPGSGCTEAAATAAALTTAAALASARCDSAHPGEAPGQPWRRGSVAGARGQSRVRSRKLAPSPPQSSDPHKKPCLLRHLWQRRSPDISAT